MKIMLPFIFIQWYLMITLSICWGKTVKNENSKKKKQIYVNVDALQDNDVSPDGKHFVTEDGQIVTPTTMDAIDSPNKIVEDLSLRQSFRELGNQLASEHNEEDSLKDEEDQNNRERYKYQADLADDELAPAKTILRVPHENKELQGYVKNSGLKTHNKLRAKHHVPPLEWSKVLEKEAQRRADLFAENPEKLKETKGQNIAQIWHDFTVAGEKATLVWYDESKFYSFSSPNLSPETKHFTQVIWKSTKYIGIGSAPSLNGKYLLIVALYSPPGNDKTTYRENILPANSQGKDVYATIY
uniref:Toxin candidate TRINITY_DN11426_c0_g2_i1 n=1 Tax=Ceriantheomorphe brasiliensis TaxID=1048506 RepID=A0A7G7WYY8_9CNID|nr:toxin candidate TRINITY_DN11426_c0_g2_i1 [Ceriantheomorphe brasiliensis]